MCVCVCVGMDGWVDVFSVGRRAHVHLILPVRNHTHTRTHAQTRRMYLQLLPCVDKSDLVDLDAFLLLQRLLHCLHFLLWLKVEGLLAAGQCLCVCVCVSV